MSEERKTADLIEQYLAGALDKADLQSVEVRILTDPNFAKEVREHRVLLDTLTDVKKREDLRSTLQEIHEQTIWPENVYKAPARSRKSKRWAWSIAASLLVAGIVGIVYSTSFVASSKIQVNQKYQELEAKVEGISEQHASLEQEVKSLKEDIKPQYKLRATGFPVTTDGYFITNYHVVKTARKIVLESRTDTVRQYTAFLVAKDEEHDLALLRVDSTTAFEAIGKLPYTVARSESGLGARVFTLGYPKQDLVFGDGVISSLSGFEDDTTEYQLSIPVNPGNSGSPVIDRYGAVIGMIKRKHTEKEGTSYAVKSSYLENFLSGAGLTIEANKSNRKKIKTQEEQVASVKDYIYRVKIYR